jgi:CRISPR-associated protein Csm4
MSYQIYKLHLDRVHFGEGRLTGNSIHSSADRLFSALFLEAQKLGALEEFRQIYEPSEFKLSDIFPFHGEDLFLPKPILAGSIDQSFDRQRPNLRSTYKLLKSLKVIPIDIFDAFCSRNLSLEQLTRLKAEFEQLGQPSITAKAALPRISSGQDAEPFSVGGFSFAKNAGLYFIAHFSKDVDPDFFNFLLDSLQYSGIGGKRSAGFGRFTYETVRWEDHQALRNLQNRLTIYNETSVSGFDSFLCMTLTTSFPQDSELEAVLDHAHYLLKKSSGFAYSEKVTEQYRKQDLYKFAAGSTFSRLFKGDIFDVQPEGYPHSVWNFARPIFFKLKEQNG